MIEDKELGEIHDGARLLQMLPYLKAEADNAMRAIENSVMGLVNAGTLTPETAQQKWIEYISYRRMVQRMEQKVRMGTNLSANDSKLLDNWPVDMLKPTIY